MPPSPIGEGSRAELDKGEEKKEKIES